MINGMILRYIFMPQILPRFRELITSGFVHLAYFMALVFRAANIFPNTHRFLQAGNIGTYGLSEVIAEAAGVISFDRHHIDQVLLFVAIVAGLVILAIQFLLMGVSLLINPALSADPEAGGGPTNFLDFIITKNPEEDIAFRLMDRVFGIPDLFNSKDMGTTGFHEALHGLFQFYSLGLLVIAVLILLYFVAAVVAETAETGTPFGKRFNHVWAPIRLVVALGLLIPIGHGLNSAQWITLYAAKFGSGFATNGWLKFNDTVATQAAILGNPENLIGSPNIPEIDYLVPYILATQACAIAVKEKQLDPKNLSAGDGGGGHDVKRINAYVLPNTSEEAKLLGGSITYEQAATYANGGNITIRFGHKHNAYYPNEKGNVFPFCGELTMQVIDNPEDPDKRRAGAFIMQQFYFNELKDLIRNGMIQLWASDYVACYANVPDPAFECDDEARANIAKVKDEVAKLRAEMRERAQEKMKEAVAAQYGQLADQIEAQDGKLRAYGWGGSGIFYNQIADMNGSMVSATQNIPFPTRDPFVIAQVKDESRAQNTTAGDSTTDRSTGTGEAPPMVRLGDESVYATLQAVYKDLFGVDDRDPNVRTTGNIIIDTINLLLGTKGLFDMCENADVHPLAQLAQVGRGLLESAIRNVGFALGGSFVGLLGPVFSPLIGAAGTAAAGFFMTFASIGLMLGFLMYYVIPFMPFIYFFFAVTGWIKGIFEAMVGVPLWALAHLRIDGQGLPGDAAANGYYLIFEIFLRPILIVFGLLAAISVFSAMVRVLNEIFYLVVSNLSGFKPAGDICGGSGSDVNPPVGSVDYFRGPVDEFFFTIVYAIMVYLIGTSCFKLIDMIPNNILRWMGASVNTFGDNNKDAGEGLLQKLSVGGYAVTGQLQGAAGQLGQFGQGGVQTATTVAQNMSK